MSSAPQIIAPAKGETLEFDKNVKGSYLIQVHGTPDAVIQITNQLPTGLTFTDHGNNTATISGKPVVDGKYNINIWANNGVAPSAYCRTAVVIPRHLPFLLLKNWATVAAGQDFTLDTVVSGRGDQASMRFSATGLPAGVQLDPVTGDITGNVATPQRLNADGTLTPYSSQITLKNDQGQDSDTFYLFVVGAGSGPNGEFAYPDPTAAIWLAWLMGGTFWDGGGHTYITAGMDYGDFQPAARPFEVRNATFFCPSFLGLTGSWIPGPESVRPVQSANSCDQITWRNVKVYGANGGKLGYHQAKVGQHGWDLASSDNSQLINCEAWNTGGDGLIVEGDYGGAGSPCHNLTIDGFITHNAGRQGVTMAYCADSPNIKGITVVTPTEGATMDMESDVGGPTGTVGSSNVVMSNLLGAGGLRITEPLQGPVTIVDSHIGGIGVINAAAASGQPVTIINCDLTIDRSYQSGLPKAGLWVMAGGDLRLYNCRVVPAAGSRASVGPTWYVEAGASLTLVDTTWTTGDNGVVEPGGTLTVTHSSTPAFTSADHFSVGAGQAMDPFPVTFTGFPAPTITSRTGTMPPGMSWYFNSLIGTPTTPGTYTLHVTITNSNGSVSQTITITVVNLGTKPVITSPPTKTIKQGVACNFGITYQGDPQPAIANPRAALPPGLEWYFDNIVGTPTTAGTYTVAIRVTNSVGSDSQNLVITVDPVTPVAPTILSADHVTWHQNFNDAFIISAVGTPNPTISVEGTMPDGTLLMWGTALWGTPSNYGVFPITVTATNSAGTVTQDFTITVLQATSGPLIWMADHYGARRGDPIDIPVTVTGFPTPTVSVVGALPDGVALFLNTLCGTPRALGTYTITLQASNSVGTVTKVVQLTVVRRDARAVPFVSGTA